jgi:hypothetical protein
MVDLLPSLSLLLIAVAFGLSLAHALEFPGKLRLDERTYGKVQEIYYPGFTLGGAVGELGGLLVTLAALLTTQAGTARFWWMAAAFASLVAMHATYWLITHPINAFWLKETKLSASATSFFGKQSGSSASSATWQDMRDRWEYSHMLRALMAGASLVFMTLALQR